MPFTPLKCHNSPIGDSSAFDQLVGVRYGSKAAAQAQKFPDDCHVEQCGKFKTKRWNGREVQNLDRSRLNGKFPVRG